MTQVIIEIYDAFKAANVPEKEAKDAATVLSRHLVEIKEQSSDKVEKFKSDIKGDFKEIDKRLINLEKETSNIKILLYVIMAAVVYPIVKNILAI
jgi:hypothetical protein